MNTALKLDAAIEHDDQDWLVARIGGAFFLETAMALSDAFGGDVMRGLVLLTVMRLNITGVPGLSLEEDIAEHGAAGRSAAERSPTTVYAVAKRLGLNYETTRRYMRRLTDQGYCVRTECGFIAPAEVLDRTEIARAMNHLVSCFHTMSGRARRAGLQAA